MVFQSTKDSCIHASRSKLLNFFFFFQIDNFHFFQIKDIYNEIQFEDDDDYMRNKDFCHICQDKILPHEISVRDHDHKTSYFRGWAHQRCNLQFQDSYNIPVIFHNMSYDSNFFIRELVNNKIIAGKTSVLPQTIEKFISITHTLDEFPGINIRFMDSFRFLNTSLESLVELLDEKSDFEIIKKEFPNIDIKYLRRKGSFPYDYLDCEEKLFNTLELPSKDEFYSSLNKRHISDEDYVHAQIMWSFLEEKNLLNYSLFYLKLDTLLLASFFETFRNTSMEIFKLDPSFYVSLPSFSLDAALLETKAKIELISDPDMFQMIRSNIRGGICQLNYRYVEANNKYMKNYDKDKEDVYLMYFDCNALYSHVIKSYLPEKNFKFLSEEEIRSLDIANIPNDNEIGYIFEVDIEYPFYLHNEHNELPFLAEHFTPPNSKCKRLITNLYDKKKYVLHYVLLKQVLKYGLKVQKIYRVISFSQSPWLATYIEKNIDLRKKTDNKFLRLLYKTYNNSLYGKLLESLENRVIVKLMNKWDTRPSAKRLIASPFFKRSYIYDENLVAIEMKKYCIYQNRPNIVGFSILDLAKVHYYDFYYGFIKNHYSINEHRFIYKDTDSIILALFKHDIYKIMKENPSYFDTSKYPENNPFKITPQNGDYTGLFKDENFGKIMTFFCGLRVKLYSYQVENMKEFKICKGIKKCIIESELCFQNYIECLREKSVLYRNQLLIKSNKHDVYTIEQKKIALSQDDTKRYILPNNIETYAWGYHLIRNFT